MELQNFFIIIFGIVTAVFLFVMYFWSKKTALEKMIKDDKSDIALFLLLAALAFVVRLLLGYSVPGYEVDMNCFRSWASEAWSGGVGNFYSGEFFADYPPLYIYVLYVLGGIGNALQVAVGSAMFGLMVKLPAMITDILLAALVYSVAKKHTGNKMAMLLAVLILFNPAVFINSSMWGQVDSISTVLMVLTVYMLYKKKTLWGAVFFILAFLLKPQAIMIAPVVLYALIGNIVQAQGAKEKAKQFFLLLGSLGIVIGLFFLIPLPFGIHKEPLWLVDMTLNTIGEYPQATLNAFNIFALVGLNFVDASSLSLLGLPLNIWGFIFIGVICVYVLILYIKRPERSFLFALAGLLVLGVFTFAHGMHERYLYVVPILMLFAYIVQKDRRLLISALALFGVSYLNQALSLYYYGVMVPQATTVFASLFTIAVTVYTFYAVTSIALGHEKPFETYGDVENAGDAGGAHFRRARGYTVAAPERLRLDEFHTKKTMDGKDVFIMFLIAAVYACVAFTNLGATQIPQTASVVADSVQVQFAEETTITKVMYYAGYGDGDFSIMASEDGVDYEQVLLQDGAEEPVYVREHDYSNLYKWWRYNTDFTAQYVRIDMLEGSVDILEFAFLDSSGNLIQPVSVSENGTYLFDEQQLVEMEPNYKTDFYFDELYHVRTAYENIHGITPYEITHPPLGKIIIATGIELFGMNPFGWRFMGTLTGVLMLPVIYIFAKLLTQKRKFAIFAAILMAADFMHYTQTRIATIDSYSILWIMLMYLFMYQYTQTNFNVQKVGKTLLPLFLSGLFFGIGASTKWLCMYAAPGLLVIFLITMYKRYKEYRYAQVNDGFPEVAAQYKKKLTITLLSCVAFFIIIPVAIYLVSYTPYFLVTDGGAYTGIGDILNNQKYMLNYHSTLDPEYVHPFASQWYTWPADVRPVLFFSYQNAANNTIATLSTMGNPLVWWGGIVAVVWIVITVLSRKEKRSFQLLFLAIAALSQLGPWMFIAREVYIYHYFATVPFLILLIIYWLKFIEEDFRFGKAFGYVFVIACVSFFVLFYPVITGIPANADYVGSLRWLESWPFY